MRYFERLRAVEKCGKMDLRYSERRNCGTAELRCVRLCGTAVFGTAELRNCGIRNCGAAELRFVRLSGTAVFGDAELRWRMTEVIGKFGLETDRETGTKSGHEREREQRRERD